ncbi:MAG: class I SAM-dependent methyltransferase [Bacteroidia bacterium]
MTDKNFWDYEYRKQGIPSSFRNDPSGVLLWCLNNFEFLGIKPENVQILDVGCGKGRNPIYLAQNGFHVTAFDSSSIAIDMANQLALSIEPDFRPKFLLHKLEDGLPGKKNQFDLVTDIFVYKHQVDYNERKKYRTNINSSLKETGILLLSLADKDDGYYSQCPKVPNNNLGLKTIEDEAVNIQSVLFNLNELINEMADTFKLEMAWVKTKEGKMHNKNYIRKTIATIWRPIK